MSDAVTRLLDPLTSQGLAARARVLLLGDATAAASQVQARGWQPVLAASPSAFAVPPGSCDAAIVDRALVHEPWDRWYLQRVHQALRVGGALVLREPNELDVQTLRGLGYLATRAGGEAVRRVRRLLGAPPPPGPSFRGRRSSPARLDATLRSLRFEPLSRWSEGLGPARFAARLGVHARKLDSIAGRDGAWPSAEAHGAAYAQAQGHLLATRAQWTAAHPDWRLGPAREFDPAVHAARTVLVLAPHPDDEVIGAGGTLVRLVRAGARVVCVQATDGSAGAALERSPEAERREARMREAVAVGQRAGFAETQLWREDNRAFRATPALIARMAELLERERPALVFAPFITEAHEDHITLLRILAAALERVPDVAAACEVFSYEVWSVVPCNRWCDVTAQMPTLEELLFEYDVAMRIDDFVRFCADRGLFHSYTLRGTPGYLEAFHAVPAARYASLLATVGVSA